MTDLIIKDNVDIKNLIYEIRNQKVMIEVILLNYLDIQQRI